MNMLFRRSSHVIGLCLCWVCFLILMYRLFFRKGTESVVKTDQNELVLHHGPYPLFQFLSSLTYTPRLRKKQTAPTKKKHTLTEPETVVTRKPILLKDYWVNLERQTRNRAIRSVLSKETTKDKRVPGLKSEVFNMKWNSGLQTRKENENLDDLRLDKSSRTPKEKEQLSDRHFTDKDGSNKDWDDANGDDNTASDQTSSGKIRERTVSHNRTITLHQTHDKETVLEGHIEDPHSNNDDDKAENLTKEEQAGAGTTQTTLSQSTSTCCEDDTWLTDDNQTLDEDPPTAHSIEKRHLKTGDKPVSMSLPDNLRRAVVSGLYRQDHFTQSRPLGGEVELSCQNEGMAAFKLEVPMLRVRWLLNGEPLEIKPSRMLFRGDDLLVIQDLSPKDSGVYECEVEYGNKETLTVGMFALTVTANVPTVFPRETEPLVLDCHSWPLAQVLKMVDLTLGLDSAGGCAPFCLTVSVTHNTSRQWYFNGKKSALLPDPIPAQLATRDVINGSSPSMSGEWWCVVSHTNSPKRWNTSWYRVFVKDPPPLIEQWWISLLSRPWLAYLFGTVLLGTCAGVSILMARYAQRRHEDLEVRWEEAKARLLSQGSQLQSSLGVTSPESAKTDKGTSSAPPSSSGGETFTSPGVISTTGTQPSSRSTPTRS